MQPRNITSMLNFSYRKSAVEIKAKAKDKVAALKDKIEERKGRVRRLREEFKITDAVYINLLEQAREAAKRGENRMSYSVSLGNQTQAQQGLQEGDSITVGAGTVNALLTENDFIKSEEREAKRLELIVRNLEDLPTDWSNGVAIGHDLSEADLEYLGF